MRGILDNNPDTKVFTIETIMRSIGEDRFDANLIFISLPTFKPLNDKPPLPEVSAALMAGQMAAGRPELTLPPSFLEKEIPRRSLAIAIHAALPIIEATEKLAKPRFRWLSHPFCRRVLGLFLFVLAAVVAFPLIGFDPLQSLSTFVIAIGMAEGDGAAVLLGVAVGVLSLALIAASFVSVRAFRARASGWLRQIARKAGFTALSRFFERHGFPRLAKFIGFEWTDLLLMWNPERKRAAARAVAGAPPRAEEKPAKSRTASERPAKAPRVQGQRRPVAHTLPEPIAA